MPHTYIHLYCFQCCIFAHIFSVIFTCLGKAQLILKQKAYATIQYIIIIVIYKRMDKMWNRTNSDVGVCLL